MPKYVIERNLPGAGDLTDEEVCGICAKSNEVLASMAPRAQWIQSYVAGDKLFCVYIADSPEAVREHAAKGGFPCDEIHEVKRVIDPTSATPVPV
jgi:Nickel responsive protein SCO4226-like